VADAPTTTFTVTALGRLHTVSVQALGFDQPSVPQEEATARAKLSAFLSKMTDLQRWLPAGSLSDERPFVADELRVYVMPYQPVVDLPERPMAWPLGSFHGYARVNGNDIWCGSVEGSDLASVLAAAAGANQLTPWKADGKQWQAVLRPLLPDESGCPPG
jgi:hypothetical protein